MTSARGEATEIAREVSGQVDALYVFGGDGTYNEVLNGIDAATPLGLIPEEGRASLPRALGLPNDAVAAARRLATGSTHRIGVGSVNGRRFGLRAGSASTPRSYARSTSSDGVPDGAGRANIRFARTALRTSAGIAFSRACARGGRSRTCGVRARLERAGIQLRRSDGLASRAARTLRGRLDLVGRLRPAWARVLPRLAWYALGRGKRATARHVLYEHDADRIEVICDTPMPLEADGEDPVTSRTPSSRPSATPSPCFSDHAVRGRRRIRTAASPPSAATRTSTRTGLRPSTESRICGCPVGAFWGRPTATSLSPWRSGSCNVPAAPCPLESGPEGLPRFRVRDGARVMYG